MLLRIIDVPAKETGEDRLQIVLEANGAADSFYTESYTSPFSDNFRTTLDWYFGEYNGFGGADSRASGAAEKLIKFGQYLGDEWLGEEHQLIQFQQEIEAQGYQNLRVRIESQRAGFFAELWEAAILFESKYVLAAAVKGYTRQFIATDTSNELPELHYNLAGPAGEAPQHLSALLQEDGFESKTQTPASHEPLRVLYWVSRSTHNGDQSASNGINQCLESICAGGAISFEFAQASDLEKIRTRLSESTRPIHIFHYAGPVVFIDDQPNIVGRITDDKVTYVPLTELSKLLSVRNVAALFLDVCAYTSDNILLPAGEGLAKVAYYADQQGLGNIVGLNHHTNPWLSGKCFRSIYEQIATGLELSQAVVEARKALQADNGLALMTVNPQPSHHWALLTHYCRQSVWFFDSAQDPDGAARLSQLLQSKLFGFRSEMLPPLLSPVSDGQLISLLDIVGRVLEENPSEVAKRALLLTGQAGVGKTQLAHVLSVYLAYHGTVDYCFYFDFKRESYQPADMLEMIAPVLEIKPNQIEQVLPTLDGRACCFVLDESIARQAENQAEGKSVDLSDFIDGLVQRGHVVLLIERERNGLEQPGFIELPMQTLTLDEQKILGAQTLRGLATDYTGSEHDWIKLLPGLNGNPWLIKKVLPLLQTTDAVVLNRQVDELMSQQSTGSIIERFYQWRWQELPLAWQRLLILCSEVPGLLLEMPMIASEQAETQSLISTFFERLGAEQAKFSSVLKLWEAHGFLRRLPHGRLIDRQCQEFLNGQSEREYFFDVDKNQLRFHLSQLICVGIEILARHVIQQPNPNISNNLLFNRHEWVKHFERLWFNQDYRGFVRVKAAFDGLLQQADLLNESRLWSLDLLERSTAIVATDDVSQEEKLSWLMLAATALDQTQAKTSSAIQNGIQVWSAWLTDSSINEQPLDLPLFQQVVTFLERYHWLQQDWQQCIAVVHQAYTVYCEYEAWPRVIKSLKSLAGCYTELGQQQAVLDCEAKILNEIPYAEAPPGFEAQQMMDILVARLAREDAENAQVMVDRLLQTPEAGKLGDMLDNAQSDIYYQQGNYTAALPYYCRAWAHALQTNQSALLEQLKIRLLELENMIGQQAFNQQFDIEVPAGTVKPGDYVSELH